ncbi:MAG: hypothetical protein AB7Y74_04690 [Syntrophorhabdus sp.]
MTSKQSGHKESKADSSRSFNDRSAYWKGYMRGLRLAYHGKQLETQEEHNKWMAMIYDPDEVKREMGKGYRDGMKDK